MSGEEQSFMFPPADPSRPETDSLYLALDGWEGPLNLLLDLARRQKVDLRQISILALVDQYLTYIERAGALKLELAADYLVMAAWLAYLKSALLLPRRAGDRALKSSRCVCNCGCKGWARCARRRRG
jgi:Uncharacterized conserved protein